MGILLSSNLTASWLNNVDLWNLLNSTDNNAVAFYAIGTGCTHVPIGWQYFVVTKIGNRAIAMASNNYPTVIATTERYGDSWTEWKDSDKITTSGVRAKLSVVESPQRLILDIYYSDSGLYRLEANAAGLSFENWVGGSKAKTIWFIVKT